MQRSEVHVELLLGKHVTDVDGQKVGRIEEIVVGDVNGEAVVMEYHLGPYALMERLSASATRLPFLGAFAGAHRTPYRVPWVEMDLMDPAHPRLRCRKGELERVGGARG